MRNPFSRKPRHDYDTYEDAHDGGFYRGDEEDEDGESEGKEKKKKRKRSRRSPIYAAISGALWIVTVCLYLQISSATGYWHVTWLIFLMATAVDNIIKAVFDLWR